MVSPLKKTTLHNSSSIMRQKKNTDEGDRFKVSTALKKIFCISHVKRDKYRRSGVNDDASISLFRCDTIETSDSSVEVVPEFQARSSKKAERVCKNLDMEDDGDLWIEKIYRNKKTQELTSIFCSYKTGKKVIQEPPSGASRVVYFIDCRRDESIEIALCELGLKESSIVFSQF